MDSDDTFQQWHEDIDVIEQYLYADHIKSRVDTVQGHYKESDVFVDAQDEIVLDDPRVTGGIHSVSWIIS